MTVDYSRIGVGILSILGTVIARNIFLKIGKWVLRNKLSTCVIFIILLYIYVRTFDAYTVSIHKFNDSVSYSRKCKTREIKETDRLECQEYEQRQDEYFILRVIRQLGEEFAKDGGYIWKEFYWPLLGILGIITNYSLFRVVEIIFGVSRDSSNRRAARDMFSTTTNTGNYPATMYLPNTSYVHIQDVTDAPVCNPLPLRDTATKRIAYPLPQHMNAVQ